MTRRKILLLIKSLGRGGAEQLLVSAAPYFDRSRFDYSVAYLGYHSDLMRPLLDAGLHVTLLDGDQGVSWPLRLRSLVRSTAPDLLHVHSPVAAVVARLSLPRRLPLVYTEHNLWESYHPLTYCANLLTYWRNDHVFSVSEQVRHSVRAPLWAPWMKLPYVEVLHHGLDPRFAEKLRDPATTRRKLGIRAQAPLVGCVAAFKPQKGHRFLLHAFAEVREQLPEARLLLVGGGALLEDMKVLAGELHLRNAALFVGNRADVGDLVAALDVFVLPSLHEGLPIALLEALSLGKPVVATNVGGMAEVVTSDEVGVLVDPADVDALADALSSLLQDPERRARMGDRARKRASEFDIRTAVRRMEEVYHEQLESTSRTPPIR